MAVFDDVLTTEGQRFFMKMLTGEIQNIKFTKLVLGDGSTSADLKTITAPVHKVAEVEVDSVIISAQNDVTITAVFKNTDITEGFYMREKAIYATDGTKEILVLYANAGSLAEFIEPSTSEVYEKILRSFLIFDQSDHVNITIKDSGYANERDFQMHINNQNNPHNVTKEQIGLKNVENFTINDQTPNYIENKTLVELSSGDKLSITLGKIAKAIKDFINHIGTVATASVLGHIKIGTGLQMSSGTASVKLTDSLTTTDSTTAASATAVKMLNTNLINKVFPIGAIYMSVNNVSPASFIGGTWERFGAGRTLIGVNPDDGSYSKAGNMGGSATTNLSAVNMPSHAHNYSWTGKPSGSASTSVGVNGVGDHYHDAGALTTGYTDISGGFGNVALDGNNAISTSGVFSPWKTSNAGKVNNNTDGTDFAWLSAGHSHSVTGTTQWGGSHSHSASASTSLNFNNMTVSGTTGSTGSGSAFSNMQPYITCYMWKRTA